MNPVNKINIITIPPPKKKLWVKISMKIGRTTSSHIVNDSTQILVHGGDEGKKGREDLLNGRTTNKRASMRPLIFIWQPKKKKKDSPTMK